MKRAATIATAALCVFALISGPAARGYPVDTTLPQGGGCPAFDRWNLSLAAPLSRRWSTSLPVAPATVETTARQPSHAQPCQASPCEPSGSLSPLTQGGRSLRTLPCPATPGLAQPSLAVPSRAMPCPARQAP